MFVFDGGSLDPARTAKIHLPAQELRGWAWCTPVEASQRLSDLLARRLAGCMHALASGKTMYLENGNPAV
jgi:hypothetical protein